MFFHLDSQSPQFSNLNFFYLLEVLHLVYANTHIEGVITSKVAVKVDPHCNSKASINLFS
jgi:hypothetical protein